MFQERRRPLFNWVWGITIWASCALISCGGGTNSPAPVTLQSISVSPGSKTVAAGLTQQYAAEGKYSDGTSKALSTVTWSTSDASIAKISASGLATALKQGSVTVSATSGSTTGSAPLTVGAPNLLSLSLSPASPTISTGQTQQFTATGNYTDGSTHDLTSGATWASTIASVATVNNTGLATGVSAGTTMIQATSGGISGSSTLTDVPTISFVAGPTFASGGTHPEGVVIADFNGDGKLDIAVSNMDTNTVAVFLNDGTGNFASPIITTVVITNTLGTLAVGDFNEDGKSDLVVSTIASPQVNIVLLGNGDGTFQQLPPIGNSFGSLQTKVVDLNGDGHQDLAFALDGTIAVSIGKGDGTFNDTVFLPPPPPAPPGAGRGAYFGLAVADFNGDGKPDIAAPNSGSPSGGVGSLDYYPGNGDGTFGTSNATAFLFTFPVSIANGDFNGDGKQDVLVGFPNFAGIAFGNGDGTFDVAHMETVYGNNIVSTNGGISVMAGDLTHSGKIDAVFSDFNTGALQIFLNEALGQNVDSPPGLFSFTFAPGLTGLASGDFNGDGIQDIAVINYQTSQVSVILSNEH
jgi:hypothetical protein